MKQVTNFVLVEKKVRQVTLRQQAHLAHTLMEDMLPVNSEIIVDHVIALEKEINPPSRSHVKNLIKSLTVFSKSQKHKLFKSITREEVVLYLESHRKAEADNPMHKWIGIYNMRKALLVKFFKWLYYPAVKSDERKEPHVVSHISSYKRKEERIYTSDNLWTPDDDLLFLKYCPDERISSYQALSQDRSARSHELLKLKIKDMQWKKPTWRIVSADPAEVR